ncbi:MAG TPA: G1 family glutamic endopeptidase [Ktedonobacteraceae bacterium]|nr:G1 family glutamic endopeptidase [Ktedonobacteraceae bacterium]
MAHLSRQPVKSIQRLYCLSVLLLSQFVLCQGTDNTDGLSVSRYPHSYHTLAKSSSSSNWAGYEAQGPSSTFNKVQFFFTIPSLDSSKSGITSSWVGLSGETTSPLVQAGVDSSMDPSSGHQTNEAWIEIYPVYGPKYIQIPGGLHKGDLIYVYVSSGLDNSNTDTFYILNDTTHKHVSFSKSGQRFLSDGTTGECILELLDNEALADFGTERFQRCSTSGKEPTLHPINSYRTTKLDLANKGIKLTSTGGLDSKGLAFDITWLHP